MAARGHRPDGGQLPGRRSRGERVRRQAGAEVVVVDVGVASDLDQVPGLLPRKIGKGTADFTIGPAMSREQATAAIGVGIEVARDLVAAGNRCLLTGDMGIANTTASAALICAFTGRDAADVTGRGTGVDDVTLARKVAVIQRGLTLHQPDRRAIRSASWPPSAASSTRRWLATSSVRRRCASRSSSTA